MIRSKSLRVFLFLCWALPAAAQVVNVPLGAPLPNFQPGMNYQFPAGYPTPPGGWTAPPGVGISVGGVIGVTAVQQMFCPSCGAAQEAARAAAASGGAGANFQFQAPPLDGLNVNVLDGGVALPSDALGPRLIQSGSGLVIGTTPPAVGGGNSKAAGDTAKVEETPGRGDASGGVSAHASPAFKPADKDAGKHESEKARPSETASPGSVSPVSPSASVEPGRSGGSGSSSGAGTAHPTSKPSATGGGAGAPLEKITTKDPTPAPIEGKPGDPRAPESPQPPVDGPRVPVPDGVVPKEPSPRLADPTPTPTAKPRTVVATPSDLRSRDSVAERIDQGLERTVGFTPPVDHRIDSGGIAVPACMGASREGLSCD